MKKYKLITVLIILMMTFVSCQKGGEPIPQNESVDDVSFDSLSSRTSGADSAEEDGSGEGSDTDGGIIGGDDNEDDSDGEEGIVGGDDNEDDDDVNVKGSGKIFDEGDESDSGIENHHAASSEL